MSMNEKLKKITSEHTSNWLEEAQEILAHAGARTNARKLALRVLHILRKKEMTQTELADKMGVTRQQVTKIVKGQENFTFETIDKLEKALGVTLMTIGAPADELAADSKASKVVVPIPSFPGSYQRNTAARSHRNKYSQRRGAVVRYEWSGRRKKNRAFRMKVGKVTG